MLTRDDILKILRDNKERFAEKYGVTKLGLFGTRNPVAPRCCAPGFIILRLDT